MTPPSPALKPKLKRRPARWRGLDRQIRQFEMIEDLRDRLAPREVRNQTARHPQVIR